MTMKWKLTLRYVLSIAIVATLVVILNIVVVFALMFNNSISAQNEYGGNYVAEYYVREFKQYIQIDENKDLQIQNKGKEYLDKNKLWIQILDENSKEVYSYNKPNDIKEKHTPIELINGYKYASGFGGGSQILVGDKTLDNNNYTYLIGFPMRALQKFIFITETDVMKNFIKYAIITIIAMDFIVAIIFGYIFSKGLTKPVKKIISGVDDLSSGNYDVYYKENGIYAKVFGKLNNLSDRLKNNEVERKKVEKMREDWIANISHDIKTPLSSIKGYAEVLEEDYDFSSEEIKDYASIINKKADYIKELVDDLNLTMKLKNNRSSINKEEANIVNIVKDCVIDIFNDTKYSERDIEFKESKPSIMVNIDKTLIRRVINNLIYNALVHNSEKTSISVSVFQKEKVHILIFDNGEGISEAELKHIFERYYRGTNTGEAHKGSGLGMAIAKEIVSAHYGEINISSEIGKGTVIEIIL